MKSLLIGSLVIMSSLFIGNSMEFILLSNDNDSLYRTTLPLGIPELIGSPGEVGDVVELVEADSTRLYAFERDSNRILVLDRFDGTFIATTALDQDIFVTRRGFDISPEGTLYGVLPGMQLRTINPTSGRTDFVTNITGAARVEAIAFAPDGTLFASGSIANNHTSETLFVLSPTTGILTTIGLMRADDIDDLTFGSDGYLYGVNSVDGQVAHLLRIDPVTAAIIDLGATGVTGVTGILAVPQSDMGQIAIRESVSSDVVVRQLGALSISTTGPQLQLRWPTSAHDLKLEHSQTLDFGEWEAVDFTPVIDGDEFIVPLTPQNSGEFFRLVP